MDGNPSGILMMHVYVVAAASASLLTFAAADSYRRRCCRIEACGHSMHVLYESSTQQHGLVSLLVCVQTTRSTGVGFRPIRHAAYASCDAISNDAARLVYANTHESSFYTAYIYTYVQNIYADIYMFTRI